jgi:hypothetical protein
MDIKPLKNLDEVTPEKTEVLMLTLGLGWYGKKRHVLRYEQSNTYWQHDTKVIKNLY